MIRLFARRGASHCRSHRLFVFMVLLAGCASSQRQATTFFLNEQQLESHGRKTWFDRLVETDPGDAACTIASDYQAHPPRTIAVLPFADEGEGDYVVNKLPLIFRSEEDRARWSWTHANRLRRAIAGGLGAREFVIVPPLAVDEILGERGITDSAKLNAIPPEDLGRWLDADALVYGELVDYEGYYAFLVAGWRLSARVRMVSTEDGHEIFSCTDSRYDVSVSPVIDPIDVAIQSVVSLLKFRDISLARTEYEVGREILIGLPIAQRNIADLSSKHSPPGQRDPDWATSQAAPPPDPEGSAPKGTPRP